MRSRAQDRHGLDFDQEFRSSQGAHLDQGRNGKVPGKKLAPCLPDFFATRDIGDKDVHLDDVIHVATRRLYEVLSNSKPSRLLSSRTSGYASILVITTQAKSTPVNSTRSLLLLRDYHSLPQ